MRPIILGCLLIAVGCGPTQVEPAAVTSYENLAAINGAYARATQKLGHPPSNAEEFLPHLKEVGDPATILKSPRDGEPYLVVWNVDPRKAAGRIIACESRGKDGVRLASNGRIISKMTDAELNAAGVSAARPISPLRSAP